MGKKSITLLDTSDKKELSEQIQYTQVTSVSQFYDTVDLDNIADIYPVNTQAVIVWVGEETEYTYIANVSASGVETTITLNTGDFFTVTISENGIYLDLMCNMADFEFFKSHIDDTEKHITNAQVDKKVSDHNISVTAHNDLRLAFQQVLLQVNNFLDSDDTTLDQLSEMIEYIKDNRELIEAVTTNKVSVSDIVNDLTSNVTDKPLSAAQGVALKALIEAIVVPTKLSDLAGDSTHRTVTDAEKTAWNAKSNFSGKYADLDGKPTKVSDFNNDSGYVTEADVKTILEEKEHILVISAKKDVEKIKALFGQQENVDWNKKDIDWNAIDSQLVSSKVLVTRNEHNGVRLGDLKLRNSYGINITRVNRAGIDLLPSRSLRLQLGDRLTVVGEARAIENVSKILGNEAKRLTNPNLTSIFIGIVLGIILGSIPITIPGISMPIKLGIAGGPIIVGILMGAFGPRFHIATYATRSANLMLRQLGLTIYLAGLGLSAGAGFFETVFTWEGLKWVAISLAIAVPPVLLMGIITSRFFKTGYAENIGMLCGCMANPFALEFTNPSGEGDDPAVAYATVYPAGIFLRVISAQVIMLLLG